MQEQLPAIEWIIPGLISQGFGYLAAAPGAGKTWMLLQWALAISSGGYVFGHIKVNSGPVLFLALEDTKASLQERIRMLGHERIPDIFYYSTMEAGWAPLDDGGLQQLENAILATRPALVVIDTLTSVSPNSKPGGNPYRAEYQSYVPVRELAEEYSCAIIGAWHFAKGSRNSVMEQTSGTMGLPAVSVNRIGLVREPDSSEARIKSHSKRGKEADWALSFDMTTGQWAYQGETKEHQMSEQRKAVLAALEESGTMPFKDLLDITEMDYNALLQLIQRLKKDGIIESAGKGLYRVKET
jgi:RecA-family ATPase